MIALNKEQVKHLHERLLYSTGGLGGIRDEGLLESALTSAHHTFDGVELYSSVAAKLRELLTGLSAIIRLLTVINVSALI
jgi:death-on-curing protein